jgi:hypothetical protein
MGNIMTWMKKYAGMLLVVLFMLTVCQTAAVFAIAPSGIAFPKNTRWTSLTFNYSGILTTLTVQIKVQSPAALNDGLLARVGASLTASESTVKEIRLMTVDLKTEGRFFFNEQYTEKIWFNAVDGRAYRRIRWLKSGDPWVKIYCWTDHGVRREKIQPADQRENNQDPIKWSKITESFYPYPTNTSYSKSITDPTFLLSLVSTLAPLNPKIPHEISVFGKEQLYRLTCRREKSWPMPVSYKAHTSSGEVNISKTLTPIVFSVAAEPYSVNDSKSEEFSLLGLQDDIRIYLDSITYLPIRISGKNSIWGELVLDLSDARLS